MATIYLKESSLNMTDSSIFENAAGSSTAGLALILSTIDIVNSTFAD